MRDIVYMLGSKLPNDGAELRYSLRTLRNMPHGKVWMFTPRLPEWVNPETVGHINWTQQDGKYEDLSAKWLRLPHFSFLPDKITYMDDDMYIIKPVSGPKAYYNANLKAILGVTQSIQDRHVGTFDVHVALTKTYNRLRNAGYKNPLSPIQHIPFPLKRSSIPAHLEDRHGPYEYKTMTYNTAPGEKRFMMGEVKASTHEDLVNILARGGPWLSSDDGFKFLRSGVRNYLQLNFPEKSKYER